MKISLMKTLKEKIKGCFVFDEDRIAEEIKECKKKHYEFRYKRCKR
jgi:hypothetical protein